MFLFVINANYYDFLLFIIIISIIIIVFIIIFMIIIIIISKDFITVVNLIIIIIITNIKRACVSDVNTIAARRNFDVKIMVGVKKKIFWQPNFESDQGKQRNNKAKDGDSKSHV
jgi:hypothetical protein